MMIMMTDDHDDDDDDDYDDDDDVDADGHAYVYCLSSNISCLTLFVSKSIAENQRRVLYRISILQI